jgi:hypothetical protein
MIGLVSCVSVSRADFNVSLQEMYNLVRINNITTLLIMDVLILDFLLNINFEKVGTAYNLMCLSAQTTQFLYHECPFDSRFFMSYMICTLLDVKITELPC